MSTLSFTGLTKESIGLCKPILLLFRSGRTKFHSCTLFLHVFPCDAIGKGKEWRNVSSHQSYPLCWRTEIIASMSSLMLIGVERDLFTYAFVFLPLCFSLRRNWAGKELKREERGIILSISSFLLRRRDHHLNFILNVEDLREIFSQMSLFPFPLPNVFPCDVIVQEKRWRGEERGIISPYFPGVRSKKCKKPILIVTTIIICSSSFTGFFVWHQSVSVMTPNKMSEMCLSFYKKHPQMMMI